MSRNKKKTNELVFRRLYTMMSGNAAASLGATVAMPRWINTTRAEGEILVHSKVVTVEPVVPGKSGALLEFMGRTFVAVPNRPISSLGFRGLIADCSEDAGLLTVLWSYANWPLSELPGMDYNVADHVFGRSGGFDANELAVFFGDSAVLEVDSSDYPPAQRESLIRVVAAFCLTGGVFVSLPYSQATKLALLRLVEDSDTGGMLADLVLRATTATHWPHAFLELYRCIERLYAVPYVEELRAVVPAGITHEKLLTSIDYALGWRPREDGALERLLRGLANPAVLQRLALACDPNIVVPPDRIVETATKALYRLRNATAHFRGGAAPVSARWDELLFVLAEIVTVLYRVHYPLLSS